jgi:hypothetical protein
MANKKDIKCKFTGGYHSTLSVKEKIVNLAIGYLQVA